MTTRLYEIYKILAHTYPDAHCELEYRSDFELLVAVILSAQCTDRRVNVVTRDLFARANTPALMADMDVSELEKLIYSCGFYRNKAKNIISASRDIVNKFGGQVPHNFEDLISLSGVGRKTANVMLSVAFDVPALAVDTHVFRLAHRLGLSDGNTPYDVERDITAAADKQQLSHLHHLLIFHGRYCCKALSPDCDHCSLTNHCREYTN